MEQLDYYLLYRQLERKSRPVARCVRDDEPFVGARGRAPIVVQM